MSNRNISWAAALRELKADRAVRSPVREERLRTNAGLRGRRSAVVRVRRHRLNERHSGAVVSFLFERGVARRWRSP